MDLTATIVALVSAVTSGGVVALFTIPERKNAEKVSNAHKLVADYVVLLEKYKNDLDDRDKVIESLRQEIEDMRQDAERSRKKRDNRILELERQVSEMEVKIKTLEGKE